MADFDSREVNYLTRERVTVSNSLKALTEDTFDGTQEASGRRKRAKKAIVTVVTDAIFATRGGETASSTVGNEYAVGARIFLNSPQEIANFRCIRKTGDCAIEVEYFL